MSEDQGIQFGDHVRVVESDLTVSQGYAGRDGTCMGFTTPSVTGVDLVGSADADLAYAIEFENGESAWFASDLVEFVDFAAGTDMRIGDKRFVRRDDGEWIEATD